MKIHGVFSWYDESPSWIGTAIASLGRFCDHILAVDGAYGLYPGGKARSHPNQAETILHTAEALEVGVTLYQPKDLWWGNEVEKRNKAFDLLGAVAEDGDWLCIYDADYHVVKCNPEALRCDLEHTDCEVATYGILDGEDWLGLDNPLAVEAKLKTEWVSQTRDLYRWNPTLRVGPAHGDYSIQTNRAEMFSNGGFMSATQRTWLRGPYDLEPAEDVSGSLVVYHRTKDRAMVRRDAQQGYYHMRDTLGVESQVTA